MQEFDIVKKYTALINSMLVKCAKACRFPLPECGFSVDMPKDKKNGDFSTNIALVLAKFLKRKPMDIAEELLPKLKLVAERAADPAHKDIVDIKIAGAGFINFYLYDGFLSQVIEVIEKAGDRYGESEIGRGKTIMVEYVSANPTGPMHMGNARGGALGDSLINLLRCCGFSVTGEFYLNDFGNQIEKFTNSLVARYMQSFGDYPFPEDGYHGSDVTQIAGEFKKIFGNKYEAKESKELREHITEFGLKSNVDEIKRVLNEYRVVHDSWFSESTLHNDGEVGRIIKILLEKGAAYIGDDGAVFIKCSDKDEVLVRSNGIPTYFAADIAYHYDKLVKRNFDLAINIWGADHHAHIARLKDALAVLGVNPDRLVVITMQLVRLVKSGEQVRMSKRTGNSITLADLIDEIGVNAARFFFNMRQANSHFDFDLELAVEESSNNPVYYVQYAYARICSIIRQLKSEGLEHVSVYNASLLQLNSKEEEAILHKLAVFPSEIENAAKNFEVHGLVRYLIELANCFHTFYNAHRVMVDDYELKLGRYKLICSVKIVIEKILNILKVDAPEVM